MDAPTNAGPGPASDTRPDDRDRSDTGSGDAERSDTGSGDADRSDTGSEDPDRSAEPGAGKRRRASRTTVLVGAGALVVLAVLILTVQPWSGAQATPTRPAPHGGTSHPHPGAPSPHAAAPGQSSLAYTTTSTPQPPPTATPQSPGQLVPSGENRSDAFLYRTNGRYYLYTSSTTSIPFLNVPVASTTDFATWTPPKDAMVHLPAWAAEPFTWGPDVQKFGSHYVLYFTGFLKALDEQCIGAAFSASPAGPFTAQTHPFICQSGLSRLHRPPGLHRQRRHPVDAVEVGPERPRVAHPDHAVVPAARPRRTHPARVARRPSCSPTSPGRATIVEAPDMVEVDGVYWLAYSANWFNQPAYGIGAARCKGPAWAPAPTLVRPAPARHQRPGPGSRGAVRLPRRHRGAGCSTAPVDVPAPDDPPRPVYITRVGLHHQGGLPGRRRPAPDLLTAGRPPASAGLSPVAGPARRPRPCRRPCPGWPSSPCR